MVKGRTFDAEARETIYKIYLYFVEEANTFKREENGYFQKVQERVSKATGVSTTFISRLLDEKEKLGSAPFTTPSKTRKTRQSKRISENLRKKIDARNSNKPPILLLNSIIASKDEQNKSSEPMTAETLLAPMTIKAEPVENKTRFPYIIFESDSE